MAVGPKHQYVLKVLLLTLKIRNLESYQQLEEMTLGSWDILFSSPETQIPRVKSVI
jgi:hypothetical protein